MPRIVRAITHDVRFPTSRERRRVGRDEPRSRLLGGIRRPRDGRSGGLAGPRADVHDRPRERGVRRPRSRRSRRTSSARRVDELDRRPRRDVAAPRHRHASCAGSGRRRASSTWRPRRLVNAVWDLCAKRRGQAALEAARRPDAGAARRVRSTSATSRTRSRPTRRSSSCAAPRATKAERERAAPRRGLPRLHDLGGLARLSGGDAARSARARRSPTASRT